MKDKHHIENMLQVYLHFFVDENRRLSTFRSFLVDATSEELYHRKNFNGHITASAFIVNEKMDKILLIKHKTLKRWLQPGGHVESSDVSILHASLREVEEEVNIKRAQLQLITLDNNDHLPFDIDSHLIPRNIAKGEEEHYHHDFRYLFKYGGIESMDINLEEVSDYRWVELAELQEDFIFNLVVEKLRRRHLQT